VGLIHLYQDEDEWQTVVSAMVSLIVSRNAFDYIDRPRNSFNFRRWIISGLRLEVDDNFTLLGYYAESSGNLLPTFRDNLLVTTRWDRRLS
jgi:hypothetical protein